MTAENGVISRKRDGFRSTLCGARRVGQAPRPPSAGGRGGPATTVRSASMRVWIDLTNTAHVVVLRPLVELLERDGHDVLLTARPLSHTVELLEDWGHPHTVVGRHGGARRARKALALAVRVADLVRLARRARVDCALAHGSVDLPPACRALRIPNTTMFDYEWAVAQHHLNCRLATRVLVPDVIPPERLSRYGARPPKLVRYPGLKEEYYLAGFRPDSALLPALGLDPGAPVCVVRTAPSYALYLGGSENELLPRLLARLSRDGDTQTVVLARTDAQRRALAELRLARVVIPERALDGRTLVALADVLVSAGGTMNREAAVLGTPVWSIFEGRMGAVDELLVREGRLRLLADPDQVVVAKKPEGTRPRAVRDPADLLRLALPQLSDGRR